ncbi:MAG: TolC family protein, partial [Candidatus Omnitrophica bacterium]|nr:TolC family protein [Candidatus Omnitrophota bacterium]
MQIERINPVIAGYNVGMAYAGYDPTLNVSGNHSFSLSPGSFNQQVQTIIPGVSVDANSYNASLNGLAPMGLNYRLNGNISESYGTRSDLPFASTSGGASIQLAQPLLKNFWIDATRENILVSKKALKMSELNFEFVVMRGVTQVEDAYYDLIAARENVKVQQMAMELAKRLLAENRQRVKVGTMAPLDVQQAESQVATTQAALLAAQAAETFQQNNLKSLISENYSSWPFVTIVPAESLTAVVQAFSLQDSWMKGMTMRPDLLQARTQLESQDIVLKYSFNQLFPELDLVGSYGHNGGNSLGRDFGGVLNQISDGSSPFYSYGAQLIFPLSNRAAREAYKTSKAQKQQ